MLDTKAFPIENGIVKQTHEILREVAYERDSKSRLPKSFPVEAYELYDDVIEIIDRKKGLKVEDKGLIIPEKSIKVIGRDKTTTPLDRHRLTSHIGTLYMKEKGDKEFSMAVAIACSERGITIAFGENVWACTNQCIFGDRILSTYGSNSVPYDKMLEVFREYMTRFDDIKQSEIETISKMKEVEINHNTMLEIVGELYYMSRSNNLAGKAGQNMLNVSEVGKLMDSLILVDGEENHMMEKDLNTNLWDFYNKGTTVLNPLHNTDPVHVLKPNSQLTSFLLNKFEIKTPSLN